MEIEGYDYKVTFAPDVATITFSGSLRSLDIDEYQPITSLLMDVCKEDYEEIILDLRTLEFLNDDGMSVLSKFIIAVRRKDETTRILVKCSRKFAWQEKSLKNLQRLMPNLNLDMS